MSDSFFIAAGIQLAATVFAAGVLWNKVASLGQRIDRLEDMLDHIFVNRDRVQSDGG